MPFYGYSFNDESTISKDTLGFYIIPISDTNKLVFISKDYNNYKLYNKSSGNLLVEGGLGGRIYVDYVKRFEKWVEYYESGHMKASGFYYENNPVGLWVHYYENGQLKELYSIALIETDSSSSYCKVGTYQKYFANGQIEVDGLYKAQIDTHYVKKISVNTGHNVVEMEIGPVSKKFGIWNFYNESGHLEKREEFYK